MLAGCFLVMCEIWLVVALPCIWQLGGETHREASTTKYKTDWIQFSASLHVKHPVVDLSVWMTFLSTGFEWMGSALRITGCDMWQWTVCRWRQRLCFHCKECLEENKNKQKTKQKWSSLYSVLLCWTCRHLIVVVMVICFRKTERDIMLGMVVL